MAINFNISTLPFLLSGLLIACGTISQNKQPFHGHHASSLIPSKSGSLPDEVKFDITEFLISGNPEEFVSLPDGALKQYDAWAGRRPEEPCVVSGKK